MHPMRHLISVTEAKRPGKPAPMSHGDLLRQEQERQANLLVTAKQAVTELKARAMQIATASQRSEFDLRGAWNQEWVIEVRAAIKANTARDTASNQEELAYERETNPDATLHPVNLLSCAEEALSGWWDDKKDRIDWSDARYNLERYFDAHNQTEMSDDISRLQAEDEMLKHLKYLGGGFGSIAEMEKTLDAFHSYLEDLNRYSDGGWSPIGTTSFDLFKKGIPVIVAYCKLIESAP